MTTQPERSLYIFTEGYPPECKEVMFDTMFDKQGALLKPIAEFIKFDFATQKSAAEFVLINSERTNLR